MCGIFGILTSRGETGPEPAGVFSRDLKALLAFRPSDVAGTDAGTASLERAVEALRDAREKGYHLVRQEGFIAVLRDGGLRDELRRSARAIGDWTRELETLAERGAARNQKDLELLNTLIVGGRDLAWQIERDLLGNVDPVRRLLGGEDFPPSVLGHGWQLNLVLNAIDRLEVRGRDSAGVAIYARYPSGEALDRFLDAAPGGRRRAELLERGQFPAFSHLALVRPDSADRVLLFAYKVADEVGEIGDNVRFLRESIARDGLFQAVLREPGVEIQALAHTRWASNGVVSVPNCHPVDSTLLSGGRPVGGSRGSVVAVLNGDVDNYQELFRRYIRDQGLAIDEEITTDAKIIPLVVGHHYRRTGNLEEAFRLAFEEFEGSMAIGIMAADRPGEFLFGQKGSGQGLFIGPAGDAVAVASEMYGLVELTQTYLKAEGEKQKGGEVFRIALRDNQAEVRLLGTEGEGTIPSKRWRTAEITTRDINRGEHPRFLLKEISESVDSVRKTLRGKFEVDRNGHPQFFLGPEVLDPQRLERLRSGAIRRIACIGQGTAAIAASGIAHLLEATLAKAPRRVEVQAMKATEFSGHGLKPDMSDTLVIAVSQSGTTTDTNRTVDLLRERGAWIIAIVNRRNSDLVYKSHGVLYTSDGRDIEMSVASTKAFYAQNVAGQVLALALAQALGSLGREEIARALRLLQELPGALAATLSLSPAVEELARRFALRRSYWAVVGSGPGKIAADEIRIKLSELCYKSIASDFLEDKKHIDLSSEPLVLVCANGTPAATLSDAVKEVAIFKAHDSIPIVIVDEGERRFDPYAAGVIAVPAYHGALGYLLATMIGHLFGFHAASFFDQKASGLRAIRTGIIKELCRQGSSPGSQLAEAEAGAPPAALDDETLEVFDPASLSAELVEAIARVRAELADGALDSGLRTGTAVRLATLFQFILGRLSLDIFAREFELPARRSNLVEAMIGTLSAAIDELARPIDAIKHQAKTVTVGISRGEEARPEGILWSLLRSLNLPVENLAQSHRAFLTAFEPLVAQVDGATLYRVAGLDAVGRPRAGSTIRVERKVGASVRILSRCEEERPLAGTKWGAVKSREIYLGHGQGDGRRLLIVPVIGEHAEGHLILFHLELTAQGDRAARLRALIAHHAHFERLKIAVTERNQTWDPALIDRLDNESLFLRPPEQVAEEIEARGATV